MAGSNTVTVTAKLLGDTSGYKKAMRDAQMESASLGQKMKVVGLQMQNVGRTMTYGVTLPIVAGFALATKAAVEEEKEMALLSKALKTNAKATSAQVRETERWVTKMQNATGVADGELRPALAALVAVTKDTEEAQSLLGIAMDISAAKGKPLQTVTEALAKAQLGNVGALGRLGIATKDAKGETLTFTEVMKNARDTYGGAASTAADTTAGKMAILKAKFADLTETVGTLLIPYLQKAADALMKVADWLGKLSPGWQKFAVGAVAIAAAVGPVLFVMGKLLPLFASLSFILPMVGAFASAFAVGGLPALGAAISAALGPIGWIILAIAGVVAVFVLLWKKCDWFRNFWIAVWDHIKKVAVEVWPVIKAVGEKIVAALKWAWDHLKKAAIAFWEWISPYIKQAVAEWGPPLREAFAAIADAAKKLWDGIKVAAEWFWGWAGPYIKQHVQQWWEAIKIAFQIIKKVLEVAIPILIKVVKKWIQVTTKVVKTISAIIGIVRKIFSTVKTVAQREWALIVAVVRTAKNLILDIGGKIAGIKDVILKAWRGLKDAVGGVWDKITDVVGGAKDKILGFVDKIIGGVNWVITNLNKLAHTSIGTLPTFSGGGKGVSANGGTGGSAPKGAARNVPSMMDNGGTGASGASGRGGLGGDTADWLKDLWAKLDVTNHLPQPFGGLFGNASGALYGLAKEALIGLLKKHGGGPGQQIIDWAKMQLGKPYLWGATGPNAFDCSGLIYRAYLENGQSIPRTGMWMAGRRVNASDARPADVGFFSPSNSQGVKYGHVKMYAGGGQTIESGSGGVHMSPGILPGASEIRTYLGMGGITRGISIAGEAGPEAVIPLTKPNRAAQVMAEAGLLGGGETHVHVYIDGREVTNRVVQRIAVAKRRTARGTA